jgi:tetratricopeptide (TPR) repeat protein
MFGARTAGVAAAVGANDGRRAHVTPVEGGTERMRLLTAFLVITSLVAWTVCAVAAGPDDIPGLDLPKPTAGKSDKTPDAAGKTPSVDADAEGNPEDDDDSPAKASEMRRIYREYFPELFDFSYRENFPWMERWQKEKHQPVYRRPVTIKQALLWLPAFSLATIEPSEAVWEEKQKKASEALEKRQFDQAGPLVEAAVKEARELTTTKRDMRLARSLDLQAYLYANQRLPLDAERVARDALKICKEQMGPDSAYTIAAEMRLASILGMEQQLDEAAEMYLTAKLTLVRTNGPNEPEVMKINDRLGQIYMFQKDYDKAAAVYSDDIAIVNRNKGAKSLELLNPMQKMLGVRLAQGRLEAAQRLLEDMIGLLERAVGPNHPTLSRPLQVLSQLYGEEKRYAEAEQAAMRALRIAEHAAKPDDPTLAASYEAVALIQRHTGVTDETRQMVRKAIALKEKEVGLDNPEVARLLSEYADLFEPTEAERMLVRAVGIYSVTTGVKQQTYMLALKRLQVLYLQQHDPDRARQVAERLLQVLASFAGRTHPQTLLQLATLGQIYLQQGQFDLAKQSFDYTLAFGRQAKAPASLMAVPTYGLATLQHYGGDDLNAIAAANQALQLSPKDGNAHAARAMIRFDQGVWDEAKQDLTKAIELGVYSPDNAYVYRWFARCQMGERDAATAELAERFVHRTPLPNGDWPANLIGYCLGGASEEALIKVVQESDRSVQNDRLCQAYFVAGLRHFIDDDKREAKRLLTLCVNTNAQRATEFHSANALLKRLVFE